MTENTGEKGPGLEAQKSGEGGIRVADAAVATDKEPVGQPAEDGLENLKALDDETAATLVGVTRAMYPHDRIPDVHYARVVTSLDEKAATDEGMKDLLTQGVRSLATMTGHHPKDFGGLAEEEKVRALKRLEDGAFFKAVAGEFVNGFYAQPDVWPYFGYEGPSNDKGGYVHRGFDDIDWIDNAPDYRGNAVEKTFVDPGEEGVDTEQRISKEG